jgi:hypothetical protein
MESALCEPKRSAAPGSSCHAGLQKTASNACIAEGHYSFLIRTAEGKRHAIPANQTIRILPTEYHDNQVQVLEGGVWTTIFWTPFGFEMKLVRDDDKK